jgi:hypothetical protein
MGPMRPSPPCDRHAAELTLLSVVDAEAATAELIDNRSTYKLQMYGPSCPGRADRRPSRTLELRMLPMDKSDKVTWAIGIVGGLLALAGVFETYTNAALHWRLLVAGIACALLSWALAGTFIPWTRRPREGGFVNPEPKRSIAKTIGFTVLLGIFCVIFVYLSWWLLIDGITFQIRETKAAGKSTALLIAPYSAVKSVTIELPNNSKCIWSDKTVNSYPALQLLSLDADSPTPTLQIDNFVYPQRLQINCSAASAIRNVIPDPPSTAMYRFDQLWWWHFWSITGGAVIWLIAGLRLWF